MRILVAQNVPRARKGGASRLMGFIHDEVEKGGHAVDYFCSDDTSSRREGRLGRLLFPLEVVWRTVAAARIGRPYDIVNVHEPSSAPIGILKRLAGNPSVVVTSHGLERRRWKLRLEESRRNGDGSDLNAWVAYFVKNLWQSQLGLRLADHVFCLNSEDESCLIESIGRSVQSVSRIFPGVSHIYAWTGMQRDYARMNTILFAGSWIKRKGIPELVAAFTEAAARRKELKLIVLGSGATEALVRSAFPSEVAQRVFALQAADDKEAALIYAAADVYVLPSHFEGTPLTLIEAMASGLPGITTATCGMKDVIRTGENGMLVPPYSFRALGVALERLLENRELRQRLGNSAAKDAREKYTWARVAQPVLAAYERLHAAARRQVDRYENA